ncbi:MAG: DivIVA domain-containing protein [Actinomycetota bacterium]|nr:DivIVA domain-containing protein [Actinomycetota bacterium]
MPLRPDEIENREFATSLRGFDKHEVRAFLRRVASDVEELETKLTSRESGWGSEGDVGAGSFAPVLDATEIDQDRFGILGERIANLLRQAHEVATETREQSDQKAIELRSGAEDELERARVEASRLREETESLKADADRLHAESVSVRQEVEEYANRLRSESESAHAEAEQLRSEAERVRADAERLRAEAEAFRSESEDYAARLRVDAEQAAGDARDRAEIEGAARLAERRALLEQAEAEASAAREAAFAEASDARQQVATLLEEARAQSEFIKREAEEIVRTKVRTNLDQAQRRLDVLRNTETSSRNRILTAQRELEAALNRLDAESVSELGVQADQDVLIEAEQRAIEADFPPFLSRRSAAPGADSHDEFFEAGVLEGEVIEAHVVDTEDSGSDAPETSYRPSTDAYSAPDLGEEPDGGAHDEAETGDVATPENEDALARLVREAMQRVVEDARNENR